RTNQISQCVVTSGDPVGTLVLADDASIGIALERDGDFRRSGFAEVAEIVIGKADAFAIGQELCHNAVERVPFKDRELPIPVDVRDRVPLAVKTKRSFTIVE